MHPFISFLEAQLSAPLPGEAAQLKMAPKPLDDGPERQLNPAQNANKSGVLILLFPNEQKELELLLTLRSQDIDHGGQLSLPGGRNEAGETIIQTALRETQEEVGVSPQLITVLGTLTELYVSHSNNLVTPVAGFMSTPPEIIPNSREVEEAFSVEVQSLASKKNLTVENWNLHHYVYKVPYWDVHRVPLWGATAMILSEFLEIYRKFEHQSRS